VAYFSIKSKQWESQHIKNPPLFQSVPLQNPSKQRVLSITMHTSKRQIHLVLPTSARWQVCPFRVIFEDTGSVQNQPKLPTTEPSLRARYHNIISHTLETHLIAMTLAFEAESKKRPEGPWQSRCIGLWMPGRESFWGLWGRWNGRARTGVGGCG